MKRIPIALTLLAALAACEKSQPEASETGASVATPANNAVAAPAQPAPGVLPPADANLRFVGIWAAEPALCDEGAWRFSERGLETAGEVSCQFERLNPVPGGYDIATMCTAEGEETRDTLRLRFAESAKAMMVETDKMLQPTGLTWCGPEGAAR